MKRNLKTRFFLGFMSSAFLICGTGNLLSMDVFAATEHWNDASASATAWDSWKTNWSTFSSDFEHVSLTPGADETKLNYAWYSKKQETPAVRISKNADMSVPAEFKGTQTAITLTGLTDYFSNKVTVSGLEENTEYYYQIYQDGAWQSVKIYKTNSFSNFSFLYVGDPQIGASTGQTSSETDTMSEADANLAARNDAYNWTNVLFNALSAHSNVSFIVSAGDQVNTASNETEYAGFLGASVLSSIPLASTIGNHDSKSSQYSLHFNNPNSFTSDMTDYTTGETLAGSDYYYTYGNVLFIVIDTNNYNCATHENVIKKAVTDYPDAKWRVVTFHQDIYGSGADHSDSDGMILRTQLTPIMDKYDIDVVMQGHDHTYSRSYELTSDGSTHSSYDSSNYKTDSSAYASDNNCYDITDTTKSGTVVNPEGTLYLEANSSTGSKFYNLITAQQDFISERSQTWTPSYSVINVTDTSFKITTYDAESGQELSGSSSYTIEKKAVPQTISSAGSYVRTYASGATFNLNAKTDGDGTLSYHSSDASVASVDQTGKVTLKGEGIVSISITASGTEQYETVSKTVTIYSKPKTEVVKAVSQKKNQVNVSWVKDSKASGYQVIIAQNKNYTRAVSTYTVTPSTDISQTVKGLVGGSTYYVKARSYKTSGNARVYGEFSSIKTVKCK